MAYKDEYEVARLYTDGAFREALDAHSKATCGCEFHLAPPLFARRDPETGHLVKHAYGGGCCACSRCWRALSRLRGTRFDPFGRTAERRMERQLIAEYESLMRSLRAA